MQRCAGLGFAAYHRPIDWYAAAVFGQQGTVHIERAAGRGIQHRLLQHIAVIKRKQKIGLQGAYAFEDFRCIGIFGRDGGNATLRA